MEPHIPFRQILGVFLAMIAVVIVADSLQKSLTDGCSCTNIFS